MIRVVHLSDFHLNMDQIDDFNDFVMKALISDLKTFNEEKKIDIIVFSGDLIDQGGKSFDNDIEYAFLNFEESVINPLSNQLLLPKDRFFFSPGNHDLKKSADEDYEDNGLTEKLKSIEIVNDHIDSKKLSGMKRILPYKEFEKDFYNTFDGTKELSHFESTFKLKINDRLVGITSFNTSWRCYDSNTDKGKLIIGERQFIKSRKIINNCDIAIAIMHHPIDWLKDFEYKYAKDYISKDYGLLLCGHVHEGSSWIESTRYGNLFRSIASSNWTSNIRSRSIDFCNGYSIIDYGISDNKLINHFRRYSHKREKYIPDVELGDDNGMFVTDIPSTQEVTKLQFKLGIARKIQDLYLEDKNEHLLSYYTNTKAPKNINELFVMPIIVDKEQYGLENEDKEEHFNVMDICTSNKNQIIFGMKESGKTVLMDKILIEFTNNIERYEKIPVHIDFGVFSHSRFETEISQFLGVKILDIESLLINQDVVILIDNFEFSKKANFKKIDLLQNLIKKYPNIQVIAASSLTLSGEIPLELFDYSEIALFRILTIKNFRVKQIRELMIKWFKNSDNFVSDEKVDNLIKVFHSFNLPSNPLAVSMFLWIIEQQENYKPINNASMLENFVERLFKKQCKVEIYSDNFDYRNKERLLAEIAFKMYEANNKNYYLTYNEVLNFVHEYLIVRKFEDFNDIEIIEHFIEVGVLLIEKSDYEDKLRFRFNCIFKYFLMKKMDYSEKFKNYVLSEENYLNFIDEIDYYTGLNRGKDDILNLVVDRMSKEYEDIIQKVESEKYGFDNYFETSRCITSQLDTAFVDKITKSEKPTEDQLDKVQDKLLDKLDSENGIERKEEVKPLEKLEKLWVLSARVLKNTEETEVKDLKLNTLRKVTKCSMAFAILYKYITLNFLKENDKVNPLFKEELELQLTFLPYIHQSMLHNLVGTNKLSAVIREKIEKDTCDNSISGFENFITIFLYADIKGKDYKKYIRKFINGISRNFVYDITLLKIISYYYLRSKTDKEDIEFENLLGDLHIRCISKSKRGNLNKGIKTEIMNDYRKNKKSFGK
jgi:predicted MPP superfamily phosphohydrolase